MELTGERLLPLPRAHVWQALNDPAVLRRCLPGCESFEAEGENAYQVTLTAAVGPIRSRFKGRLRLSDLDPPSGYSLRFEGSGGAAGFGKGSARVTLADDAAAGGTRLAYAVDAQVGGRLAQLGNRLVDGVARKLADDFFSRFAHEAGAGAQGTAAGPAMPASPATFGPGGVSRAAESAGATAPLLAAAVSVAAAAVAVVAAAVALHAR
jgi:carbon monoxide dehydrogenase subunit G